MQEQQTNTYLLTIFATSKEEKRRIDTAKRIALALQAICPNQFTHVHPDETKLVLLVQGEYTAILKAVDAVCQPNDDSWLLTQVGTPCAANGLSRAVAWIQTRCGSCP
jgi:hypothetical protein